MSVRQEASFGRIRVSEVEGPRGIGRFLAVAGRIYRNDPNWTPPLRHDQQGFLNKKENPFFRGADAAFFVAESGGRILGRVAAIHNHRHEEFHHDHVGFFGSFECENDPAVSGALLEVACQWLSRRGLEKMRGPMNLSMNDDFGARLTVTPSPETPARPLQPYNPAYYPELFGLAGLEPVKDCISMSWENTGQHHRDAPVPEGVRVRHVRHGTMAETLEDLKAANRLYHETWKQNWGFLPTSDEEHEYALKRLHGVLDPDLLLLAEAQGEVVGMNLCIPDYHGMLRVLKGRRYLWRLPGAFRALRETSTAVGIAMGIRPSFRRSGLAAHLLREMQVRNPKYRQFESNWILEDNTGVQQLLSSRCGARPAKRFRIFERSI